MVVNHLGRQYDPSVHNKGFVEVDNHIAIITKLDTSGAIKNHQYVNRFIEAHLFAWQSQNQQRQDNASGRLILDHRVNGNILHLFVQPRSHEKAYYCGRVNVARVEGNAPMNVQLELENPLSEGLLSDIGQAPRSHDIEAVLTDGATYQDIIPLSKVESVEGTLVPFYPVDVAAGSFLSGDGVEPSGWVNLENHEYAPKSLEGLFVTRIVGRSMEPTIPNGSLCVFRRPVVGSRQGRILLVQKRDLSDPDTGGSFTVKRYRSQKVATDEGWRHETIELIPDNKEYSILRFQIEDDADLQVIGELIHVLKRGAEIVKARK